MKRVCPSVRVCSQFCRCTAFMNINRGQNAFFVPHNSFIDTNTFFAASLSPKRPRKIVRRSESFHVIFNKGSCTREPSFTATVNKLVAIRGWYHNVSPQLIGQVSDDVFTETKAPAENANVFSVRSKQIGR